MIDQPKNKAQPSQPSQPQPNSPSLVPFFSLLIQLFVRFFFSSSISFIPYSSILPPAFFFNSFSYVLHIYPCILIMARLRLFLLAIILSCVSLTFVQACGKAPALPFTHHSSTIDFDLKDTAITVAPQEQRYPYRRNLCPCPFIQPSTAHAQAAH